jgi:hypothetical protein
MDQGSSAKLFHTIVVLGAALASADCGSAVVVDGSGGGTSSGTGASGQPSASNSMQAASSGQGGAILTAGSGSSVGSGGDAPCSGDVNMPTCPQDCASTSQFCCDSYAPYTNCRCDPTKPVTVDDCTGGACFLNCVEQDPPVCCDCVCIA